MIKKVISLEHKTQSRSRFFLQQCDYYAGSPEANAAIMIDRLLKVYTSIKQGKITEIPMVVFSEMTLPLLEARDLLKEPHFIDRCVKAEADVVQLAEMLGLMVIYGTIQVQQEEGKKKVINCIKTFIPSSLKSQVAVRKFYNDQEINGEETYPISMPEKHGGIRYVTMTKTQLPCYGEQDEAHATDIPSVMSHCILEIDIPEKHEVLRIGFGCCEQTWTHKETNKLLYNDATNYRDDPTECVAKLLTTKDDKNRTVRPVLLNLSESNFADGKIFNKTMVFSKTAETIKIPIIYVNRSGVEGPMLYPADTAIYYPDEDNDANTNYGFNTKLGESECIINGDLSPDFESTQPPGFIAILKEYLSKTFKRLGLANETPLEELKNRVLSTLNVSMPYFESSDKEEPLKVEPPFTLLSLFLGNSKKEETLTAHSQKPLSGVIRDQIEELDIFKCDDTSYNLVRTRKGIVLRLPQSMMPIQATNMPFTSSFYVLMESILSLPLSDRPKASSITVLHYTPLTSFQQRYLSSKGVTVLQTHTNVQDFARQHELLSLDCRTFADMMGKDERNVMDKGDLAPLGALMHSQINTRLERLKIPNLTLPNAPYLDKRDNLLEAIIKNPFDITHLTKCAKKSFLWGGPEELIGMLRHLQGSRLALNTGDIAMLSDTPTHTTSHAISSTWPIGDWVADVLSQLRNNQESLIHPILKQLPIPSFSVDDRNFQNLITYRSKTYQPNFKPFSDPPLNASRIISEIISAKKENCECLALPPFSLSGIPGDYGINDVYIESIHRAWDDIRVAAHALKIDVHCFGFVKNIEREEKGGKPCVLARFEYKVDSVSPTKKEYAHLGLDPDKGIFPVPPFIHNKALGPEYYRWFEQGDSKVTEPVIRNIYSSGPTKKDDSITLTAMASFAHPKQSTCDDKQHSGQVLGRAFIISHEQSLQSTKLDSFKIEMPSRKATKNEENDLMINIEHFLSILLQDSGLLQLKESSFDGIPREISTILENRINKGRDSQYFCRPSGIVIPVRGNLPQNIAAVLILCSVLNTLLTNEKDVPLMVLSPTPLADSHRDILDSLGVTITISKKHPTSFANGEGLTSNFYMVIDPITESERMSGKRIHEEWVSPLVSVSDQELYTVIKHKLPEYDTIYSNHNVSINDRFLSFAWRLFSKYDMDFSRVIQESRTLFLELQKEDPIRQENTIDNDPNSDFGKLLAEALGQYLVSNDAYRGSSRHFPSLGHETAESIIFRPATYFNDELTRLIDALSLEDKKFCNEPTIIQDAFQTSVKNAKIACSFDVSEKKSDIYPNAYRMMIEETVNSFLWALSTFSLLSSFSIPVRLVSANVLGALSMAASYGIRYSEEFGEISSRQATKAVQAVSTLPLWLLVAHKSQFSGSCSTSLEDMSLSMGMATAVELVSRGGLESLVTRGSLDPASAQSLHRLLLPLSQSFLILVSQGIKGIAFPALCLLTMLKGAVSPTCYSRPGGRDLEQVDTYLQTLMLSGIVGFDAADILIENDNPNAAKAMVPIAIMYCLSLMYCINYFAKHGDHTRGLLKTGLLLSQVVAATVLDPQEDHLSFLPPFIYTTSIVFLLFNIFHTKAHKAGDRRGSGLT